MKFKIDRDTLSAGLATVGRAVARRPVLPVLMNVRLNATFEGLELSASNLRVTMRHLLGGAVIEEEGDITLPAGLLSDFVRSLPGGTITIDVDQHGTAHLTSKAVEANIKGLSAESFPVVNPAAQADFYLPTNLVQQMITRTSFAAATDESRPILTGVCLNIGADRMFMAAADGFRLSVCSAPYNVGDSHDAIPGLIVPATALAEVVRLLSPSIDLVGVHVGTGNVTFFVGDTVITTQQLEGTFPDYMSLVPASFSIYVTADRDEMIDAIEVARVFSQSAADLVKLKLAAGGKSLEISALSSEMGDSRAEVSVSPLLLVQADTSSDSDSDEEFTIGFNGSFLLECIKAMPPGAVALKFSTASGPGLFEPHQDATISFQHVIMPMQVRGQGKRQTPEAGGQQKSAKGGA